MAMDNDSKSVDNARVKALKNKINALNEIVKGMPKNKMNQIDGCYFTADPLRKNSENIMVKMNYKNESNVNSSVSITINVNKLLKLPANEVVKELYRVAGKAGMANENAAQPDAFKAEIIIARKANEIFNRLNLDNTSISPLEITKRLIFILPDEKIAAIVEGKMTDAELEGLVNQVIEANNLKPSKHNAPSKEQQVDKELEENGQSRDDPEAVKKAEARVKEKNDEFVKSLQVEGGADKRKEAARLLDGNIYERSEAVNNSLTNNENLKASFNNLKENMQSKAALEAFSKEFSKSFMAAQGLPPIPVKIVNNPQDKGTMGEFVDNGSSHYIEINQAGITNITEFTATLAHELTHAVDSSLNKINGRDGIQNSMNFDITDTQVSGRDKALAEALLSDLNFQCYQADPCEQTARNGEQIGLDFIKGVVGNELDSQIEAYKAVDEKTQRGVNNVRENFAQIIANAQSKLDRLSIDAASRSKIQERINYLKTRQREKEKEDARYYGNRERHQNMSKGKPKGKEREEQTELEALQSAMA